jgi:polyphosphate kinase 2
MSDKKKKPKSDAVSLVEKPKATNGVSTETNKAAEKEVEPSEAPKKERKPRELEGDFDPRKQKGKYIPTREIAKKLAKLSRKRKKKFYEDELYRLQVELVKLQEWVRLKGLRVVVIFEGRDAAGKGGVIKRIEQHLNPRICKVVALPKPTERERTQWYFQRYTAHLPAAGELVLLDRSWYNRAGVERVMNFCSDDEYSEFLRSCPDFERMLVRSGIILLKYWFSVSHAEQEKRFQERIKVRTKRWKISDMDILSRSKWQEYSKAKDEMFAYTDIKQSPWYVVNSDDKKKARLNCIAHLLSMVPYEDLTPDELELPPLQDEIGYMRPPLQDQSFIPELY